MKGAIEAVLTALYELGVRYLVVGGIAVILHGYLRTTADLDLFVCLERENIKRALRALESVGYRPRLPVNTTDFADPEIRKRWIEEKGMLVFALYNVNNPMMDVDLFVREPFDFDAVYARALSVPLEQTTATVVSVDDLIAMKEAISRPRDVEDVKALRALRSVPKDSNG